MSFDQTDNNVWTCKGWSTGTTEKITYKSDFHNLNSSYIINCCMFRTLDPLTCSNSEVTLKIIYPFKHFSWTPSMVDRPIVRPLPTQEITAKKYVDIQQRIAWDSNPWFRLSKIIRALHYAANRAAILLAACLKMKNEFGEACSIGK